MRQDELDSDAQKMVADAQTKSAGAVAKLKEELAAAKTSKPVSLWPIYLIAGIAIVTGPAIAYWLGKVAIGIVLALSGVGCIAFLHFLQRYPWAMWIPFGLGVIVAALFLVSWIRGVMARYALEAIIPAVETKGTPQLKAEVETNAKEAKVPLLVRAAVTNVKARIKLGKAT